MLEKSFHDAVKALTMGTSQSALIRARERAYVKTLVGHLQREFDAEDLRVFAPSQRGNAADFGRTISFTRLRCVGLAGAQPPRASRKSFFMSPKRSGKSKSTFRVNGVRLYLG